jgi:hypothetical protein
MIPIPARSTRTEWKDDYNRHAQKTGVFRRPYKTQRHKGAKYVVARQFLSSPTHFQAPATRLKYTSTGTDQEALCGCTAAT